ncbi:MAG: hypothetical protein SGCHY_001750 [Lobulomycetales sp.]
MKRVNVHEIPLSEPLAAEKATGAIVLVRTPPRFDAQLLHGSAELKLALSGEEPDTPRTCIEIPNSGGMTLNLVPQAMAGELNSLSVHLPVVDVVYNKDSDKSGQKDKAKEKKESKAEWRLVERPPVRLFTVAYGRPVGLAADDQQQLERQGRALRDAPFVPPAQLQMAVSNVSPPATLSPQPKAKAKEGKSDGERPEKRRKTRDAPKKAKKRAKI